MRTPIVVLFGFVAVGWLGCQVVGGLDELQLVPEAAGSGGSGGMGGAGGSGGSETTTTSSVSSSSSSSGEPIIGDLACGASICPLGLDSACCHDKYLKNGQPQSECVIGNPGIDNCNTAGGTTGLETRIECQFPYHCPTGTTCCGMQAELGGQKWYTLVSCQPTCELPNIVICDPADPVNSCPIIMENGMQIQTTCAASTLLPDGYSVCWK